MHPGESDKLEVLTAAVSNPANGIKEWVMHSIIVF